MINRVECHTELRFYNDRKLSIAVEILRPLTTVEFSNSCNCGGQGQTNLC